MEIAIILPKSLIEKLKKMYFYLFLLILDVIDRISFQTRIINIRKEKNIIINGKFRRNELTS
jgi:hypothetical protein